jgi:acyl-coenzyme A thioesterase PaaI-like protein
MLASIADNALGFNVARAMGSAIATVHLSIDYLGRSAVGDWLEVRTVIDKRGGRICFAQCTGHSQGAPVFKASGIFSAIALPERA